MRIGSGTSSSRTRAILAVAASFTIVALAFGTAYSFGIFVEPLQNHFGWSRAMTSGAFSTFMIVQGILSVASGRLSDRYGARLVVSVSGILFGVGLLLLARLTAVWQFYVLYGLVLGAAFGGVPVPVMSAIARQFGSRMGLMTGVVMAGTGAGTMVVPFTANWLIGTYGWSRAYMVLGVVLTTVVLLAAQFLRPAETESRPPREKTDAPAASEKPTRPDSHDLALSEAIHTRQFWLLCIAFLAFGYAVQSIVVHLVVHARGLGFTSTSAASLMVIIGGLSIVGRLGLGSCSDRLGGQRLLVAIAVVLTASLIWLALATQSWAVIGFASLFGFVYGGITPLYSRTVMELFGLRAHGAIMGAVTFSLGIGCALGPLLTGYCFDVLGSYTLPFVIGGCIAGLGALSVQLIRPLRESR
jgi:MFS family permease